MAHNKWTIARRAAQISTIALIASPLFGLAVFQGNLSAATVFGIGLADPLAFLQATLAGRILVLSFLASAAVVMVFYLLTGGRTFCGWVCPVYLITEVGDKVRRRLQTGGRSYPLSGLRWSFCAVLVLSLITGIPLFEVLSPIGVSTRAIMFKAYTPLLLVAAILVVETLVSRRVWCRSLCPAGGFYSLIGRFSPVRISFSREACTHCGECTQVCPVEEVLAPCLDSGAGMIAAGDCTRCGGCIDVCEPKALKMGIGYK